MKRLQLKEKLTQVLVREVTTKVKVKEQEVRDKVVEEEEEPRVASEEEPLEVQEALLQEATKADPLDLDHAHLVVPGGVLLAVLEVIRVHHQAPELVHLQGVAPLPKEGPQEVQEEDHREVLPEEEGQQEELEEVHQEVQEDPHHQEAEV